MLHIANIVFYKFINRVFNGYWSSLVYESIWLRYTQLATLQISVSGSSDNNYGSQDAWVGMKGDRDFGINDGL